MQPESCAVERWISAVGGSHARVENACRLPRGEGLLLHDAPTDAVGSIIAATAAEAAPFATARLLLLRQGWALPAACVDDTARLRERGCANPGGT